jgi:hypothetical protein
MNVPAPSFVHPKQHASGMDYSFVCTKPDPRNDVQETVTNYEEPLFAERVLLLKALPVKFRNLESGNLNLYLILIGLGSNPTNIVHQALSLLKEAHGRASHIEAVIVGRLKQMLSKPSSGSTPAIIDILMCSSGMSYYCDKSRTMNLVRSYLVGIRNGIKSI